MSKRARSIFLGLALASAVGAAGCYATLSSRTTATARTPTFVMIDGDVWVMENYDEPVFFTDGFYWRFSHGGWYRSNVYDGGWVTISVIPDSVRRIDRPTRYVRYVGPSEARRHVGPPSREQAREERFTPPERQAPVAVPPPDRGPPAGVGGGPPPDRGPPAGVGGGPPPDRGPPAEVGGGKPDKEVKGDKGNAGGKPDKGHGKGGKKK